MTDVKVDFHVSRGKLCGCLDFLKATWLLGISDDTEWDSLVIEIGCLECDPEDFHGYLCIDLAE